MHVSVKTAAQYSYILHEVICLLGKRSRAASGQCVGAEWLLKDALEEELQLKITTSNCVGMGISAGQHFEAMKQINLLLSEVKH